MRILRIYLIIAALNCGFTLMCMGQSISPVPGNTTICKGVETNYNLVPGPSFSGCGTVTWTVTNGSFSPTSDVTSTTSPVSNVVKVTWKDIAGTGTLTATSNCSEGALSVSKTYAIKSLAGRSLANARANQTLPFCSTGTINLAVDVMFLENTGGTTGITQQRADGYEWVLPTGWKLGGTPGTVTSTTEFINIEADNACRGGSVTVRAFVDGGCTSGKSFSAASTISIARPTPTITVTPQAGYAGPSCGSGQPVTFTVNHNISCIAPNNGFLWNFPSGWLLSPIFTNINSITVTPSGNKNDAGTINVTVNLACGTALPATPLQLVFNAPVISAATLVCSGGSNVTLSNVTPSILVTWSGGTNMTVSSGQGTSSAVIMANSTGSLGNGTISATVNCANAIIAPKTVWVGTPESPGSVTGNTTPSIGGIYQYVSEYGSNGAAYHNWLMPYYGNPLWSVSGGNINGIVNTLTPNFIVGSSTGNVQVFGVNACGNSGVRRLRVTPTTGGGGGIQQIIAYPNPAQKDLTIEVSASSTSLSSLSVTNESPTTPDFSVTLLNDQYQIVKSGVSKKGKITFDVQDLRNGFYYLNIQKGEELSTQQIQIKK